MIQPEGSIASLRHDQWLVKRWPPDHPWHRRTPRTRVSPKSTRRNPEGDRFDEYWVKTWKGGRLRPQHRV